MVAISDNSLYPPETTKGNLEEEGVEHPGVAQKDCIGNAATCR